MVRVIQPTSHEASFQFSLRISLDRVRSWGQYVQTAMPTWMYEVAVRSEASFVLVTVACGCQ